MPGNSPPSIESLDLLDQVDFIFKVNQQTQALQCTYLHPLQIGIYGFGTLGRALFRDSYDRLIKYRMSY